MTTDAVGGVWTYSLTLARALAARGVEVALAAIGPEPSAGQVAQARAAGLALTVYPCRLEWQEGSGPDLPRSAAWLRAQAARLGADLVHSNQFAYGAYTLGPPVLVVGHSDLWSWQAWCHPAGKPIWPPWAAFLAEYRAVVAAGLRGAAAVVAPSRFMAANLRAYYGIDPALPVTIIHNGSDSPPHAGLNSPPPPLRVLAAGRLWDPAKNLRVLAEAVGTGIAGAEVAVAGPLAGPQGEGAAEADRLQAAGGIQWLGALAPAAMAARLAASRVFVGASRYEPFGLAPLEAAGAGCALLLSDIPAFRELWDGAACFFPPDDPDALRALLHAWATPPQEVNDWAARARERARHYTAATMAAHYHDLYERIRTGA
jgi:glycosyltransferase involved in cell wall biosynthesis